jgi:hypothetical protein
MSQTNEGILRQIHELVDQEHRLRGQGSPTDEDRAALTAAEQHLDQLWDLLRRRQALREAGADPDTAAEAPASQVESYLQ